MCFYLEVPPKSKATLQTLQNLVWVFRHSLWVLRKTLPRYCSIFTFQPQNLTSKPPSKLAKSANPPLFVGSVASAKGSSSSSLSGFEDGGGGRLGPGPPAFGGGGLDGGGGLRGGAPELFGGRAGVGLSSGLGAIGGGSSSCGKKKDGN